MGNCFSDLEGGKQAVGGGSHQRPQNVRSDAGHNDAVDHFFRTKGLHALFTKMELSLSASKLRDLDVLSKSDPMVVSYQKKRDGSLEELGRTEVIMNNLDPVWIQKINVTYQFEIVQPLIFRIYDVDTKYHNLPLKMLKLNDQEFLGEASCYLSEIVTRQNQSLTLNLHHRDGRSSKNLGTLTVHAEETVASRDAVEMTFRCSHLENKDLFSKSDPFLRISRTVESGGSIPICKTEVVNNNLSPVWKPVCLTMQQYGSKENPLVIECFDFNSDGNHVFIGKLHKSVAELITLHQNKTGANFISPPSGFRRHEKLLKGQLFVDGLIEKQLYSFLDYISSGFELNFMVAVDFTASNGNPRSPDSLHYINPSGQLNAYQQAIMEVGEVIQFYDSDKRFPAWGFGGRSYEGSVSHCFNLNGSPIGFEVEGVEGIMSAYASALQNVTLAGPTLFGQVINKAADIAGHSISDSHAKYYVLLIITDGVLTDLQETIDSLVRASDLPLSILIVGVGGADFTQMEILDADTGRRLESSTGRIATRDIVQFVPMREVHGGQISVVQALLEELPGQFLTYVRSRDIVPLNVGQSHSEAHTQQRV
ncbi:protein BONZAI 3 isoform X1 [Olea europaea var. sylvestris]|uniref:protein BONZAI 3 isoform X1 n=1 Tax=Olea europaea var. sylvestris TaxID=158386 RepID=UPI000C1CD861|nr:protein BONZAI 3 isoform X1 [Olea europaea var. sylvestris]